MTQVSTYDLDTLNEKTSETPAQASEPEFFLSALHKEWGALDDSEQQFRKSFGTYRQPMPIGKAKAEGFI